MKELYSYVGPKELLELVSDDVDRICISSLSEVHKWLKRTNQILDRNNSVTSTYIIDIKGVIWIGDRHMEHVVCAKGQPVLSAGEITLTINETINASFITNQSTGFCPKPQSWKYTKLALEQANIRYPEELSVALEFRICTHCNTINIIKENHFYCAVCDNQLPNDWNILNQTKLP
jgi:hypothetical protein